MEREVAESERNFSKKLFNGLYRLEVLAEITAGEAFNLKELNERMGQPPGMSSLQKELKLLAAVGLLSEQPAVGGMREVYYIAEPSPLWECARTLQAQFRVSPTSSSPLT